MNWTNICIEGFCFADTDEDGKAPCGNACTSNLCVMNGHCPHFAYSDTTERMVAHFTPIWLILKDRIPIWAEELYWKIRWIFWDRLSFNKRKVDEFFDSIPIATAENSPSVAEWDKEMELNNKKFDKWFRKVRAEARGD